MGHSSITEPKPAPPQKQRTTGSTAVLARHGIAARQPRTILGAKTTSRGFDSPYFVNLPSRPIINKSTNLPELCCVADNSTG